MHSNCAFVFFSKVTQRQSGEVMVMKELLNYDETAKVSFLKEVSYIFLIKLGWTSAFSRHSIYKLSRNLMPNAIKFSATAALFKTIGNPF